MSLGTYMIVQKIVNSLTNVFLFPRKNMKHPPLPPPKKKMLKHNLRERVENSVAKRRNACMEKGFNVHYSVIREDYSEF